MLAVLSSLHTPPSEILSAAEIQVALLSQDPELMKPHQRVACSIKMTPIVHLKKIKKYMLVVHQYKLVHDLLTEKITISLLTDDLAMNLPVSISD